MIKIRKFREAFKAGQAGNVVQKIGNILGRRIGMKVNFASIPIQYSNDYGEFAGYIGSVGTDAYVKINFLLEKSDMIYSFDVYNGQPTIPDYTVDTAGLNIVQIVELLEENLIDDDIAEFKESVLKERGRPSVGEIDSFLPGIERWVEEDSKILDLLQDKPLPEIYSKYFLSWAKDKPRYAGIKFYMFTKIIKRFLLERGLTNRTFRKRKKGSKERQVEDVILQAQMEEVVETMGWRKKFEKLELFIKQMGKGTIQSVYLYGSPGSGKSKTTIDVLNAEKVDYKIYKGGFAGTSEMVQVLYNNRDNMVLVFDDADSIRTNRDQVNILKAALENTPDREITWAKKPPKGFDFEPRFTFTSGIIFISNETKLDAALASRSINLRIDLSSEEMIDKMKDTLEAFMPDVPIKTKTMALDFASEVAGGVAGGIDYRILQSIIIAIQVDPGDWKATSMLLLTSIPQ